MLLYFREFSDTNGKIEPFSTSYSYTSLGYVENPETSFYDHKQSIILWNITVKYGYLCNISICYK